MDIATTEKFLDDLAELPASVSKKCRDVLKELHRATASDIMKGGIPGWRLHKLQSSPFRSISVDMQYRMLVKIERNLVFRAPCRETRPGRRAAGESKRLGSPLLFRGV
jgi:hypothetical protein